MKLYSVWFITPSYQEVHVGVFSSKEKAQNWILSSNYKGEFDNFSIVETRLDEGYLV